MPQSLNIDSPVSIAKAKSWESLGESKHSLTKNASESRPISSRR